MGKQKYIILLLLLGLMSCSHNKIYEKYIKIENRNWKRDQIIKFEVPVEDTVSLYNVTLAIRHTSYYTYANIRVNMMINYPTGDMRVKDYNILVRNTDGSFLGDGVGDLWDVTHPALEGVSFPFKGIYVFEVQNVMPLMATPDIMDVGLIVRKSKKKIETTE
ncbi:MAG: gliding motility lipoprotein GldH [Bacteroidales bacterium]|jgi:gliding motility-associated lipoprotein GldH|nr:gliding motility lipoprotein GldH [Bacteroidales bacterium]